MLRALVLLWVTVLAGCASSGQQQTHSHHLDEYCYTKERIEINNNETVNSNTVVECNDNVIDRIVVKQAGLAENCGISQFQQKIGGKIEYRQAITCQFPDGSWDIIGNLN